jgi:hypothetical protein
MLRRSVLKGLVAVPFGTQQSQGFNNSIIGALQAGNTIINGNGLYVYSSKPAHGNLIFSSVPVGVTADKFQNVVIGGSTTTYNNIGNVPQFAISSIGSSVQLYIWNGAAWVLETWHTLGALAAGSGYTVVNGRYKLTPELETVIDINLLAGAATVAGVYLFANALPPIYQPGQTESYPMGWNGTVTAGMNFPSLRVTNVVNLQLPALPLNTIISETQRIPLN